MQSMEENLSDKGSKLNHKMNILWIMMYGIKLTLSLRGKIEQFTCIECKLLMVYSVH